MAEPLEHVAERAVRWSVAADRLQATQKRARRIAFGLSIAGALAAALASQIPDKGDVARWHANVAMLGAACLALATFVSARFLGQSKTSAWIRARAASEALKREAFRFAAGAAPYDASVDPAKATEMLNDERDKIEAAAEKVAAPIDDPGRLGGAPRTKLAPKDYLDRRVVGQVEGYYREKVREYRPQVKALRVTEFALAAAATLITVYAGAAGKTVVTGELTFDIAALTAVLTTVSGAILAHLESSRIEYLIERYSAAARRLEDEKQYFDKAAADPQDWSKFVNKCEDIIAAENTSWIAKWSEERPH